MDIPCCPCQVDAEASAAAAQFLGLKRGSRYFLRMAEEVAATSFTHMLAKVEEDLAAMAKYLCERQEHSDRQATWSRSRFHFQFQT